MLGGVNPHLAGGGRLFRPLDSKATVANTEVTFATRVFWKPQPLLQLDTIAPQQGRRRGHLNSSHSCPMLQTAVNWVLDSMLFASYTNIHLLLSIRHNGVFIFSFLFVVPGIEPMASSRLSKYSTTKLHLQAF